ncbi:MAG: MAPEG family protein [Pseudomonadota bacterium]
MLTWIIAAIALYYVGLFLPAMAMTARAGLIYAASARDAPPPDGEFLGRARRAHENLKENLAPFLAIALLTMIPEGGPAAMAVTGAAIWVIARLVYIPIYLVGVPWVRTLVFFASLLGLVMMILSLL